MPSCSRKMNRGSADLLLIFEDGCKVPDVSGFTRLDDSAHGIRPLCISGNADEIHTRCVCRGENLDVTMRLGLSALFSR